MRYVFILGGLLVASQLVAQQATQTNPDQATDQSIRTETRDAATDAAQPRPARTFQDRNARTPQKVIRASKIIGTNVKNKANEDLGSINDLVIDPMDGRIAYAAVSMGGFLGVGDKLFAVPWDAIECREVEGEHVAFLDVNKQSLERAQGFDQEHWPDFANEKWRSENDRPYQALRPSRHDVARPIQPSDSQRPRTERQPDAEPAPQRQQ